MRAGTLHVAGGMLETGWWGPGPEEAPTLVLLHEGLGSVGLWRDVPARLAAATGWGVFAYSRFGYGGSDTTALPRPMTYLQDEALAVLPEVLRAAGILSAILIGHSDGGSIAAIYAGAVLGIVTEGETSSEPASDRPPGDEDVIAKNEATWRPPYGCVPAGTAAHRRHGVRAVVGLPSTSGLLHAMTIPSNPGALDAAVANTGGAAVGPPSQLLGLITIAAHFVVEELNIVSIRKIKTEYEAGPLRQRLSRYHVNVDAAFRGWNDAWLDPRFQDFDITGFLPAIQVPILALQGADDPYGTDIQLRVLKAHVTAPIDTRLIAAARHAPHLEATDETLAAITSFIANFSRDSLK